MKKKKKEKEGKRESKKLSQFRGIPTTLKRDIAQSVSGGGGGGVSSSAKFRRDIAITDAIFPEDLRKI